MAMPTLVAMPWPNGPVVVSTPDTNGIPDVRRLAAELAKVTDSSNVTDGWPKRS